jgi:hypothetical protein
MATYKESNLLNAKEMFLNRINYEIKTIETSTKYSNLVDFNFAEKRFYGKVNRNFVPIVLADRLNNLKTLPSTGETTDNFRAVNFVVDQFQQLSRQFDKCILTGKIAPEDKYLSKLQIFKAYTSVDQEYNSYLEDLRVSISNAIKAQNKQVVTFKDFLKEVDNYFEFVTLDRPFTIQHFIKSKFSSPMITGLSIEIADLDPSNDLDKVNNFFNSRNWEFYVNTCNSFGFMVDKDVPWRITADIASKEMLDAAANYGFLTTDSILNRMFNYRVSQNYLSFKTMINSMAIATASDYYFIKECKDGSLKQKRLQNKLNIENITEEEYLKIYLKLRFREEEVKLQLYDQLIIETNLLAEANKSVTTALFKVELFLSQPFDLSGSLSDRLRQIYGE